MKKPKKTKPLKAWAVVDEDGKINAGTIDTSRAWVKCDCETDKGERVIKILITEIEK